ncbi:hypothetical protein NPIL_67441 [Nephila pilipes]|uniref:Uncharacterized protein n=1 Tax=Nephila pilipes TaxID=299642 RepID=A0A8X6PRG1_NEPPI|nr:hypothetical protein NPIL_67441 [Nephila pilipes]
MFRGGGSCCLMDQSRCFLRFSLGLRSEEFGGQGNILNIFLHAPRAFHGIFQLLSSNLCIATQILDVSWNVNKGVGIISLLWRPMRSQMRCAVFINNFQVIHVGGIKSSMIVLRSLLSRHGKLRSPLSLMALVAPQFARLAVAS